MSVGLSDPAAQTAAYTYTDAASGLSFTVPANRAEAPLSDERNIIDAKFLSNGEDGATIFFTVEDLFPGLAEANKGQLSRGDIGNSVFSKSEIADALGCKTSEVSTVTVGGREYYYAETAITETTTGGLGAFKCRIRHPEFQPSPDAPAEATAPGESAFPAEAPACEAPEAAVPAAD